MFGDRVASVRHRLDMSDVFNRDCAITVAWDNISTFSKDLETLENEAQDLKELQELLEAAVVDFRLITQ